MKRLFATERLMKRVLAHMTRDDAKTALCDKGWARLMRAGPVRRRVAEDAGAVHAGVPDALPGPLLQLRVPVSPPSPGAVAEARHGTEIPTQPPCPAAEAQHPVRCLPAASCAPLPLTGQ